MNYKILTISIFDKQAKRLAKKYPSLKSDLLELATSLSENPEQGDALGNNFFKVRMAIKSKNKGKSGGTRIITYVKILILPYFLQQFMINQSMILFQQKHWKICLS